MRFKNGICHNVIMIGNIKMDQCKHRSYRRNVHTSHLSESYVYKETGKGD